MSRKFLTVLSGIVILSGMGAVISFPSAVVSYPNNAARNVQFYCDNSGPYPTTIAVNSENQKSIPVIKWYSEFFTRSGFDPLTRCNEVSQRFQAKFNDGSLDFITAGIVNTQPVICATTPKGSCSSKNVLFTLKPGTNAAQTLQRLFDVRDLGAGPLVESSGRTYISMQQKLAPLTSGSNGSAVGAGGDSQNDAAPTKPGSSF